MAFSRIVGLLELMRRKFDLVRFGCRQHQVTADQSGRLSCERFVFIDELVNLTLLRNALTLLTSSRALEIENISFAQNVRFSQSSGASCQFKFHQSPEVRLFNRLNSISPASISTSSTSENPLKFVTWLFFSRANPRSRVHVIGMPTGVGWRPQEAFQVPGRLAHH